MILHGIDTDSLPPQFDTAVPGRVLLLDGDAAIYKCASTVKTLDTAVRRFVKSVLEYKFLTNCSTVRVHLTSKKSIKANRDWYPAIKPYQGNRTGKPKPPLVEPLRNAIAYHASNETGMIPEDWVVMLHDYWEADDGLIMDAVYYKDGGVIWSEDKDLRLTPGPYYEIETGRTDYIDNRFGWISEAYTPGGDLKAKGHGTKFFWWQMLAGDEADNVKGITKLYGKLCGKRAALDLLQPIMDENEACNRILWAYAKNQQHYLPEAELLWLRRHPEDSAAAYIGSLDLDPKLRKWHEDQIKMHDSIFQQRSAELEREAEAIDEVST